MKIPSLDKAIEFYLTQRRQLGFPLKEDGQMLRQLARYAAHQGHRGPLTRQLALAWAQAPTRASRLWWPVSGCKALLEKPSRCGSSAGTSADGSTSGADPASHFL